MMTRYIKGILAAAIAATSLCGCSISRKCRAPELNLPSSIISSETPADQETLADMQWWNFYGDSLLCNIIERTLEHNKDILAAAYRIEQMREQYRISRAELLPTVSANALADNETNDYFGKKSTSDPEFSLKATLSWEADLWGRLRWAKKKNNYEWLATVEDERAMRMTLIAEVAGTYFQLIALDNELEIVRRTLETRRDGEKMAKLRFEGGLTSELVYQQAKVEYATTATLVPALEKRIEITENSLSLLMGAYPGEKITRQKIDRYIQVPDSVPVGLPSQLLMRRPDVRKSEYQLKSAMSSVGVAYADQFPRLTISLQGGWENDDLKALFRSPFSYVVGNIVGTALDFGRKRAQYKASIAAYEQSRLAYEKKVLEVFTEVNNYLVTYRKMRDTTVLKTESRNAALKYFELANLQYRAGSINYIDVLDAQRRFLDAQIGLSNAVRDEHIALVNLYKALGGGWKQ